MSNAFNWDDLGGREIERQSNFWKPEKPGDMIVGYYVRKRDAQYGPVAIIGTFDGAHVPVGLNAVLEDLLSADLVGSYVAIRYKGDIKTKGGPTPMRDFQVKVLDAETVQRLTEQEEADDLPF